VFYGGFYGIPGCTDDVIIPPAHHKPTHIHYTPRVHIDPHSATSTSLKWSTLIHIRGCNDTPRGVSAVPCGTDDVIIEEGGEDPGSGGLEVDARVLEDNLDWVAVAVGGWLAVDWVVVAVCGSV
jgi:hypothetical protein